MALNKVEYKDGETVISAENLNDIQDSIMLLGGDNVSLSKVLYVDGQTVIAADNLNQIQDAIIKLQSGAGMAGAVSTLALSNPTGSKYLESNGSGIQFSAYPSGSGSIVVDANTEIVTKVPGADFGNAKASDVASGKTFTSASGLKLTGTNTGTGGGHSVAFGTTTTKTINTGLSSISLFALYKTGITAAGLVQAIWFSDKAYSVYCSSYSDYVKNCISASSSTYATVSGGSFTWSATGNIAMIDGAEYNWIAVGTKG